MKIRLEIDEPNGKAFNSVISDKHYETFRACLLAIEQSEQIS